MKKLIFKSGKTVDFVECYSRQEFVQGVQREVLDFRFDAETNTLDGVDAMFAADECSELIIRETKVVSEQAVDETGDPIMKETPVLNEVGEPVLDEDGNAVVETIPAMVDVEHTYEYLYYNFTVRAVLSKQFFTLATENGATAVEQISVKMAKQTETEIQLANIASESEVILSELEQEVDIHE